MLHWKDQNGHYHGKRVSGEEYEKMQKNTQCGDNLVGIIFVAIIIFLIAITIFK